MECFNGKWVFYFVILCCYELADNVYANTHFFEMVTVKYLFPPVFDSAAPGTAVQFNYLYYALW